MSATSDVCHVVTDDRACRTPSALDRAPVRVALDGDGGQLAHGRTPASCVAVHDDRERRHLGQVVGQGAEGVDGATVDGGASTTRGQPARTKLSAAPQTEATIASGAVDHLASLAASNTIAGGASSGTV